MTAEHTGKGGEGISPEGAAEAAQERPGEERQASAAPSKGKQKAQGAPIEGSGMIEAGRVPAERPGAEVEREGAFSRITHPKKIRFLEAFADVGTVTRAAKVAGIERRTHYWWLKDDPDYAAAYQETQEQAADMIEAELVRRAVEGVEKPVHYQGKRVDVVREYSDILLIFLLKGLRPAKYRDSYNPALITAGGNVTVQVQIPRPGPQVQMSGADQVVDVEARELGEAGEGAADG